LSNRHVILWLDVEPAIARIEAKVFLRGDPMMRKFAALSVIAAVAVSAWLGIAATNRTGAGGQKAPMVAHMVYFSLKDNSPAAKEKMVAACKKYLTGHPGTVTFYAGVLAKELDREVNDRDFDVSLHMVFQDMKSHDLYQEAPRHKDFINENQDSWKKVRVFDSIVE
jgi:hypothetical protein